MAQALPRIRSTVYSQTAGDLFIVAPQFTRMVWARPTTTVDALGRGQQRVHAWAPLIWWNQRTGTISVQAIPANARMRQAAINALLEALDRPERFDQSHWKSLRTLSIPAQQMLAWAKKTYRPWLKDDPPEIGEARYGTLTITGGGASMHAFPWGRIELVNLTKPDFKTHSRTTLTGLCRTAVETCQAAWDWARRDLVIELYSHTGGNAMGLAFNPGRGTRRISLNRRLLQNYDEAAILRTILHELCHHAREELHPRPQGSFQSAVAHDERFCEMLAQVDPIVADNQQECIYFRDDIWEGGVAAARQREVPYSAEAGHFLLRRIKSGHMRLDWVPHTGRKQVIPFSPIELRRAFAKFSPADLRRVEVELGDPRLQGTVLWPPHRDRVRLAQIITTWWNRYPAVAKETRSLFQEAA